MNKGNESQNQVIGQFIDAAERFCLLIENHQSLSLDIFVREIAELLVSLYKLGLLIPDYGPVQEEPLNYVLLEQRAEIINGLSEKLKEHNYYWVVFNPYEEEDPVTASLGDDLTDIYSELKDGLIHFTNGTEEDKRDSVWHWKFGFVTHWGNHLVNALKPIHKIIADL